MKDNEVPQDPRDLPEGEKVKKLIYATNGDGRYVGKQSIGWEPENIATGQAWEVVNEQLADAIQQVQQGESSPILYYMVRERMDLSLLAKYVRKFPFQVKRHLKPKGFASLSATMLQRYAEVFGVSVAELRQPKMP